MYSQRRNDSNAFYRYSVNKSGQSTFLFLGGITFLLSWFCIFEREVKKNSYVISQQVRMNRCIIKMSKQIKYNLTLCKQYDDKIKKLRVSHTQNPDIKKNLEILATQQNQILDHLLQINQKIPDCFEKTFLKFFDKPTRPMVDSIGHQPLEWKPSAQIQITSFANAIVYSHAYIMQKPKSFEFKAFWGKP